MKRKKTAPRPKRAPVALEALPEECRPHAQALMGAATALEIAARYLSILPGARRPRKR